jgi:N-acetyl-gamma-glutamyl-phosphate reductase
MAGSITVGIIGAAGYAGAELVRILARHPKVDALLVSSTSYEGKSIADIYPNFLGCAGAVLQNAERVIADADVVFAALPHGVGEDFAAECFNKGKPYIDLSADFRFDDDEDTYAAWYGKNYKHAAPHSASVYGLPELNRDRIRAAAAAGKVVIGNPGCYPTAASLAVHPALSRGVAAAGTIIVDAASGITGGGREPLRAFHFPECSDSMTPYKVGAHRHTPEISRNFRAMETDAAVPHPVIFTPHLAPMNRGILSTAYIPLAGDWKCAPLPASSANSASSAKGERPPSDEITEKTARVHALYKDFYKNEPFVRVLPPDVLPSTGRVRQSNFCDISVRLDQNGSHLIAVSVIDNMVKGAAGQAVQNMNIVFGFDEGCGLDAVPALF